ncbi:MAG: DEAD/DEAH box helicase [Nitrosarchaeum sp.]|nr:DEAD/DEAH box helicase [Nitrosarchaeum sp.]
MILQINVNNVNTIIVGDVTANVLTDLSISMTYKTLEYNGFTFVEIEHKLFNRIKQSFPTGLFSNAITVLKEHNLEYEIFDKRISPQLGSQLNLHDIDGLWPYQTSIVEAAIEHQRFIIQVATGGGKTVIAAAILAKLNVPSMFVVHTGDLFEQAYDELSRLLKVPIGRIGGGMCEIEKINICMIQTIHAVLDKKYVPFDDVEKEQLENDEIVKKSFIRNDKIKKFLSEVRCVLVDECHHLRSDSYVAAMKACKLAYFKGGLSATPFSGDSRDLILQAYAGKIIGQISASYLIDNNFLVRPTIYYLQGSKNSKYLFNRKRYNTIYKKYIVNNKYRNDLILDCVRRLVSLKKTVLITVTTKKHGKILLDMVKEAEISVEFIYSHVDKMTRKKYINQIRERKLSCIIGTCLADEGLNIPALDSLILAGAGKSPTRMIQRIGRTLRKSPGKTEAVVIDFKDNIRYLSGHYKKRRGICEKEPAFKIVESF